MLMGCSIHFKNDFFYKTIISIFCTERLILIPQFHHWCTVVDTVNKLIAGVIDTTDQFIAGIVGTGDEF
jgi:hypothetical protein